MEEKQFIDLEFCVPEKFVETASFAQLSATIKESPSPLTKRQLEVLDYIYRHRLMRCLLQHYPTEDLRELNNHLEFVTHPVLTKKIGDDYLNRWRGYSDVLEARLGFLQSSAPIEVLKNKDVRHVWDTIERHGLITRADLQAELQQDCDFKETKTERILEVLYANELVVCKHRPSDGKRVFQAIGPHETNVRPIFEWKGTDHKGCGLR